MKGYKSGQKENSRTQNLLKYRYPVDLPFHFELYQNVLGFWNTVTYWPVWLFVTRLRQLGSFSLKARHPVDTAFAHAQTFDCCFLWYVFSGIRLQSNDNSTCDEFTGIYSSFVFTLRERRNSTLARQEICSNLHFQIKHKQPRGNISLFMLLFVFSSTARQVQVKGVLEIIKNRSSPFTNFIWE